MKLFILFLFVLVIFAMYLYKRRISLPDSKAKHVILISIDALRSEDIDYLKALPNFREILKTASHAKNVESIYPSLTYPCHTTIVTGRYPEGHGIENNLKFEVGNSTPDWYWYSKDVEGKTLYGEARKRKLKVGSIFWPVMAGANIDYNLAEIWPHREDQTQSYISLKTGTKPFILNAFLRYGKLLKGTSQPYLDNFTTKAASYMIRSRKPNLCLFHLIDLDDARHKHGTTSKEAFEALCRQDTRVGEIIAATKKAKIYKDTAFVILGDHSFIDVNFKIFINSLFVKEGLITLDSTGKISNWIAYSVSCGGSCQIKLNDSHDLKSKAKVEEVFTNLLLEDNSPIEKIYNKKDLETKGASSYYDYMLEGKKGYYFNSSLTSNSTVEETHPGEYKGTHGFDPDKSGYDTSFIIFGKGIKSNVVLPKIRLVDEGPTIAKILGLDLGETEGTVLNEFLL